MPRIPESSVTRGLPGVSSAPVQGVLAIGNAVLGVTEAGSELAARLSIIEKTDELTQLSGEMEGALADLQLQIQQDRGLNTPVSASAAFNEGAEAIFSDFGTRSDSNVVRRELEKNFIRSSLQANIAVKSSGYRKQVDASLAGIESTANDLEKAYAVAGDPLRQQEIRDKFALGVNLNEFATEQQKVAFIEDFNVRTATASVRSLIDTGQFDKARDLLNSNELVGLDPQQELALLRTLDVAERRALRLGVAEAAALENAKINHIVKRMNDPENEDGFPTVLDVLEANMGRIPTEHFIGLIEDEANGIDLTRGNANIYNDLYARVRDPDHVDAAGRPDAISDISQILPFVGENGITTGESEKLNDMLTESSKRTTEEKVQDKLFLQTVAAWKTQIDRTSPFFGKDPLGAENFQKFVVLFQDAYDEGLRQGKNPRDMLRPYKGDGSHPDSIMAVGVPFHRTEQQIMRSRVEAMSQAREDEALSPSAPEPTSGGTRTVQDWLDAEAAKK